MSERRWSVATVDGPNLTIDADKLVNVDDNLVFLKGGALVQAVTRDDWFQVEEIQ